MPPGAAEMAALEAPWGHMPTEGTELIVGLRVSPGGERQPRGRGVRPGHGSHRWGRVRPPCAWYSLSARGGHTPPWRLLRHRHPGPQPSGAACPPTSSRGPPRPFSLVPRPVRVLESPARGLRVHLAPASTAPAGEGTGRAPARGCPRRPLHGTHMLLPASWASPRGPWPWPSRPSALPLLTVPSAASALSFDVPQLPGSVFSFAVPWGCFRGPSPAQTPPPSSRLVHLALSWTIPTLLCSPDPTVPSAPWGLGSDDGVADGCRDLCCLHSGSSAGLWGARRAGGQCGPEAGVDLSTWTPSPSNARARASLVSRWPVVGQGPSLPTPGPPFGGAELATWVTLPCQPGSRGPSTASGASAPSRRRGGCRLRGLGSPAWTGALSPGFVVTA